MWSRVSLKTVKEKPCCTKGFKWSLAFIFYTTYPVSIKPGKWDLNAILWSNYDSRWNRCTERHAVPICWSEILPLFSKFLSRFRPNSVYEIYIQFCSLDVSIVKVGAAVPYFTNVLKRMWKKAVSKPNSVYCHEICIEELRRSNRISTSEEVTEFSPAKK